MSFRYSHVLANAKRYPRSVMVFIPCFLSFYLVAVSSAVFSTLPSPVILDIVSSNVSLIQLGFGIRYLVRSIIELNDLYQIYNFSNLSESLSKQQGYMGRSRAVHKLQKTQVLTAYPSREPSISGKAYFTQQKRT